MMRAEAGLSGGSLISRRKGVIKMAFILMFLEFREGAFAPTTSGTYQDPDSADML